jgi:hypothetical protein
MLLPAIHCIVEAPVQRQPTFMVMLFAAAFAGAVLFIARSRGLATSMNCSHPLSRLRERDRRSTRFRNPACASLAGADPPVTLDEAYVRIENPHHAQRR